MMIPDVDAVTGIVHVILSEVVGVPTVPTPVPPRRTSSDVNVVGSIAPENTAVNSREESFVGSACPDA